MNNVLSAVVTAIEAKWEDLKVIRIKRQERIESAYSEANHKLSPNVDRHYRLHAPCDGYEDVDGRGVYAKGEYLPIPESVREAMELEGCNASRGQDHGYHARFLLEKEIAEEVKKNFEDNYGLACSFGQTFERGSVEVCYVYVKGNYSIVKAIEEAVEAAKAAEFQARRALKGESPEGKQVLKCKILHIRPFVPMNSFDYGSDKMMVEFENKSTAWGTLPKALAGAVVGEEFILSATFKKDHDDNTHSYFSRPSVK